jgi:glutamate/aspartate transport system substrate-binding protein
MRLRTAVLALCALASPVTAAQEPEFGLDHFRRIGQLVIAHREAAIGFSYTARDDRPSGYSVDVCNRIVDRLRHQLGTPDLRVRYAKATAITRFLLVKGKHADLECGITSNTLERQQDFLFSNTIATRSARLIALAGSGIGSVEDLRGRRLAVITDTTDAATARRFVAARGLDADVVPVRNNVRAYQALMDGTVDAFFGTDVVMLGEAAQRGTRQRLAVVPGLEADENIAIVMAKDRPALKAFVDREVAAMAHSGELATLYRKWFLAPLPLVGITLGVPMPESMKAALAHPNDAASKEPDFGGI